MLARLEAFLPVVGPRSLAVRRSAALALSERRCAVDAPFSRSRNARGLAAEKEPLGGIDARAAQARTQGHEATQDRSRHSQPLETMGKGPKPAAKRQGLRKNSNGALDQ